MLETVNNDPPWQEFTELAADPAIKSSVFLLKNEFQQIGFGGIPSTAKAPQAIHRNDTEMYTQVPAVEIHRGKGNYRRTQTEAPPWSCFSADRQAESGSLLSPCRHGAGGSVGFAGVLWGLQGFFGGFQGFFGVCRGSLGFAGVNYGFTVVLWDLQGLFGVCSG